MNEENYEVPDKDSGEDIEPINHFNYSFVKGLVQDMQGKMLTTVEAITNDKEQRKAAKDLVRNMFNTQLNWLFESAHLVKVDTRFPHSVIPIKKAPTKKK